MEKKAGRNKQIKNEICQLQSGTRSGIANVHNTRRDRMAGGATGNSHMKMHLISNVKWIVFEYCNL